jgi:recombination protein RecR
VKPRLSKYFSGEIISNNATTYQHKILTNYSSKILEEAVHEFSKLPGIGKRTALRLVLYLLKQSPDEVERFGHTFLRLRNEIRYCTHCHNISETEVCSICSNQKRDGSLICVVEDVRDVIAIENTNQFNGKYHVLGGIISPMDGIGPGDLNIETLLHKIASDEIQEVIMALSATMEGDTTVFYLYKKIFQLDCSDLKFSTIARGVSIGDELEYADEATLGRSIVNRTLYENSLVR